MTTTTTAVVETLTAGTFLTNGTRLVEITKVTKEGVFVEEGSSSVEAPDLGFLRHDDVESNWRKVKFRAS